MIIKKTITILLFSFLFCTLKAQTKKHHTNGKLKEIGFYDEQGYKIGEWKEYYLSGKLYSLSIYKGFSIYWKHYYENGQFKESGEFIEHKKQGKWNYYFKNGDLTKTEIYYYPGVLEERKRYYKGILYSEEYYKNGKKEGVWKYYNQQNGKLKQIEHYTKGKGNGDFKSFFTNGNLIYSYSQVNGSIVGERKDYYKSEKNKKIQTYEDGKL